MPDSVPTSLNISQILQSIDKTKVRSLLELKKLATEHKDFKKAMEDLAGGASSALQKALEEYAHYPWYSENAGEATNPGAQQEKLADYSLA